MSETLKAKKRTETGTLRMRRMRQAGMTPAVLYGHGLETVNLAINSHDIEAAIRHGALLVDLKGDVNESAFINAIQWDELGSDVLHLDLTRVDATEEIEVDVAIELRGDAPGTHQGGILDQNIHEVTIRVPANKLPEKLELNINELELDQALTLADLEIPEGVQLLVESDDAVIVQCVEPQVAPEEVEEEAVETAGEEPEVIGRKPEEDEGAEEGESS